LIGGSPLQLCWPLPRRLLYLLLDLIPFGQSEWTTIQPIISQSERRTKRQKRLPVIAQVFTQIHKPETESENVAADVRRRSSASS
jgi:hypothetical protein